MLQVKDVSLRFGTRVLFDNVNLKFMPGNCYGLIGANGSGKSTFIKLLSKELDTTTGEVMMGKGERIGVLEQNHFAYEEYTVMDTVLQGHKRLYEIIKRKEVLYNKDPFTDKDGIELGDLEAEFLELDGWSSEANVSELLSNLGVGNELHYLQMSEIAEKDKVKVLLAQALFSSPDVLLLDEPTNGLDIKALRWFEEFLINYEKTVIVVSHDRYFLNKVCTHIADLDFNKITLYAGNYDFWYQSSQLALQQSRDQNKKKEDRIKELQDFIARFSANASKSKQATSRKKTLEKIELEDIKPSSRKYPFIEFKPNRPSGKEIVTVHNVSKTIDGRKVLNNVSFQMFKNDKIVILSDDTIAKTTLMKILAKELEPDTGTITYGTTITNSYFPLDNSNYFKDKKDLFNWISQYYQTDDDQYLRGFLGRMLFSKDEVFKDVRVLSGGEKARLIISKMMLEANNLLIMDEPTNHLDLETITSLNEALKKYDGELIFSSYDHELVQTVANRIIEILPNGIIDRMTDYDYYLEDDTVKKQREKLLK